MTTPLGKILLSIILGLGLASLFRKVCTDKNCINFHGPVIEDIEGKTYKHGTKCYKYTAQSEKCDSTKKIVDIGEKVNKKGEHSYH
jgi:hypothetical protein